MNDNNFLRAICLEPSDDCPRLIYADYLEERGDPRGEFIRVQCAMQKRRAGPAGPVSDDSPWLQNDSTYHALRRRERELLKEHGGAWTDGLPESLVTRECPHCLDYPVDWETGAIECRQCDGTGFVPDDDRIEFRRGFVASIALPTAGFLVHAAALFAAAPVDDVRLTDKRPWNSGNHRWGWTTEGDDLRFGEFWVLPRPLIDLMGTMPGFSPYRRWFKSESEAYAVLSAACVRYGRQQADLPPLTTDKLS